jgi:hypothetical protein
LADSMRNRDDSISTALTTLKLKIKNKRLKIIKRKNKLIAFSFKFLI